LNTGVQHGKRGQVNNRVHRPESEGKRKKPPSLPEGDNLARVSGKDAQGPEGGVEHEGTYRTLPREANCSFDAKRGVTSIDTKEKGVGGF